MSDVFLMVRRMKSTFFLMCKETDTVAVVKKMLAGIAKKDVEEIRLFQQRENLESELDDSASLESLGFLTTSCKPQSPGAMVAAWKEETPEVTPYTAAPALPDVMKPLNMEAEEASAMA